MQIYLFRNRACLSPAPVFLRTLRRMIDVRAGKTAVNMLKKIAPLFNVAETAVTEQNLAIPSGRYTCRRRVPVPVFRRTLRRMLMREVQRTTGALMRDCPVIIFLSSQTHNLEWRGDVRGGNFPTPIPSLRGFIVRPKRKNAGLGKPLTLFYAGKQ